MVLSFEKVITNYKHTKSLLLAGRSLMKMDDGTRVRYFDTTGRIKIDGEWPSLMLNVLNDDPRKCKLIMLIANLFVFLLNMRIGNRSSNCLLISYSCFRHIDGTSDTAFCYCIFTLSRIFLVESDVRSWELDCMN